MKIESNPGTLELAMPRCELCGNDYDKTLSVALAGGAARTFDSFRDRA